MARVELRVQRVLPVRLVQPAPQAQLGIPEEPGLRGQAGLRVPPDQPELQARLDRQVLPEIPGPPELRVRRVPPVQPE